MFSIIQYEWVFNTIQYEWVFNIIHYEGMLGKNFTRQRGFKQKCSDFS